MQNDYVSGRITERTMQSNVGNIQKYHYAHENQPNPNTFEGSPTRPADHQCSISAHRAMVLMMCRITGLAPLTFEKQGSTWVIRVSKIAYIYSLLLISALNVAAILSIYMDMSVDPSRAVILTSPTEGIIWSVYYGLVAIAVNISTVTAPAKMKTMIRFMNRMQQVNLDINNNSALTESPYISLTMIVVVFHGLLSAYDCSIIGYQFASLYLLFFNQIFIILIFQLHVLALQSALKTVNDHLERLLQVITTEGLHNSKDIVLIKRHDFPLKSVNIIIDRLTYNGKDLRLPKKRSIHETIRAITQSFLDVCELIEEVNRSFGIIILVLLLISLVQLVTMSYYAFMSLHSKRQLKLQTAWCLKHLLTMLLLTEPCHWTYQELTRTRQLTRLLTIGTATVIGPFAAVMKKLFFCLCLNKTSYSPLGICTLTRPVCVTILGSVITYLVIVMQFRTDTEPRNLN